MSRKTGISVQSINVAIRQGRLHPISRGQQYGGSKATSLIDEAELERWLEARKQGHQPRSAVEIVPRTYDPDAKSSLSDWVNTDKFPVGDIIWLGGDAVYSAGNHPLETYLKVAVGVVNSRPNFRWQMQRKGLLSDLYQEARCAAIEAYRLDLPIKPDTYRLIHRALSRFKARIGMRRHRTKGADYWHFDIVNDDAVYIEQEQTSAREHAWRFSDIVPDGILDIAVRVADGETISKDEKARLNQFREDYAWLMT